MRNNPYDFKALSSGINPSTGYSDDPMVQEAIMSGMSPRDAMMMAAEFRVKDSQSQRHQYEMEMGKQQAMQQQLTQQRLNELGIENPSDIQGNFNMLVQAGVDPTNAATIATQLASMPFQQEQASLKMETDEIKKARDQEDVYRKEYIGASKEFKDVSRAYSKIHKALNKKNPAPSDDMAAVYSLIKLYDPNTGVREGEYAKAEQLKGVPEWLGSQYNKTVQGNFLTPTMRQQMTKTAKDLYTSEKEANKKIVSQYKALSERAGLNPENVLLDYNASEDEEELTQEQRERARYEQLKAIKEKRGF